MSRYLKLFTAIVIGGSSIVMIAAAPPKESSAENLSDTPRARMALRSNIQANAAHNKIAPKGLVKSNSNEQALVGIEKTVCSNSASLEGSTTVKHNPQFFDDAQSLGPTEIMATDMIVTTAILGESKTLDPQNPSRAQLEQRIREALIRN